MVKATQEQLKSIQQEATTKNFIFPHLGVFNIAANWGHNIKNIKYEMSKKISKYIAHWAIFTFSINNNLNITIFLDLQIRTTLLKSRVYLQIE